MQPSLPLFMVNVSPQFCILDYNNENVQRKIPNTHQTFEFKSTQIELKARSKAKSHNGRICDWTSQIFDCDKVGFIRFFYISSTKKFTNTRYSLRYLQNTLRYYKYNTTRSKISCLPRGFRTKKKRREKGKTT